MSSKLTQWGYEKLIAGNIEWLMEQERTLERSHIIDILRHSIKHYYPGDEVTRLEETLARSQSEAFALQQAIESHKKSVEGSEFEGNGMRTLDDEELWKKAGLPD